MWTIYDPETLQHRLQQSRNHFSHYSFMLGNIQLVSEQYPLLNQYLASCLQTIIFAVIYYFTLCSLSYFVFYCWKKDYFTPRQNQRRKYTIQIIFDIKWSILNILGQTPLITFIKVCYPYLSKVQYQWPQLSFKFMICLLIHIIYDQFCTYWVHRILHHPFLYKRLHRIHHLSKSITPFSGFAFHPLDAFSQAVPVFTSCYFLPIPLDFVLLHGIITSTWAISIHDNVNLIPFKGILYAGSHSIHHFPWGENYNYGKITSVCDRLYGSYCNPEQITGYGYETPKFFKGFFNTINKIYEKIIPDRGGQFIQKSRQLYRKYLEDKNK